MLRRAFAQRADVLAVDTGQHYDYSLNGLLYEQLSVEPPDRFLGVGSGSHAEQTASVLTRAAAVLESHHAAVVVVIGDTNSTLGAALGAVKQRIPVVHVEAGLRAADCLMAEEINRRMVDAVASLLCTPSLRATEAAKRERPDARVVQTGDVARDVLLENEARVLTVEQVLPGLQRPYLYCTLHRAELTDEPSVLRSVLAALGSLDRTVILPLHPRSLAALGGSIKVEEFGPALKVVSPIGYLESVALTREAEAVITDSGGVQREAYWLGVPCVTLRGETEWTETVEAGANRLLPASKVEKDLRTVVTKSITGLRGTWDRSAYGNGNAARKVAAAVQDFLGA